MRIIAWNLNEKPAAVRLLGEHLATNSDVLLVAATEWPPALSESPWQKWRLASCARNSGTGKFRALLAKQPDVEVVGVLEEARITLADVVHSHSGFSFGFGVYHGKAKGGSLEPSERVAANAQVGATTRAWAHKEEKKHLVVGGDFNDEAWDAAIAGKSGWSAGFEPEFSQSTEYLFNAGWSEMARNGFDAGATYHFSGDGLVRRRRCIDTFVTSNSLRDRVEFRVLKEFSSQNAQGRAILIDPNGGIDRSISDHFPIELFVGVEDG